MSGSFARLLALFLLSSPIMAAHAQSDTTSYGMFGALHLSRPTGLPNDVVLLLSDRDGWTPRQSALGKALAEKGALVVGIDTVVYRKRLDAIGDQCSYPAGHFEELAHWLERREGISEYRYPLVIGDGSGANLAYVMTTQAPSGTFSGLITLGWDQDMRFTKPICAGDAGNPSRSDGKGAFIIAPVDTLPLRWLPRPFAPQARNSGLTQLISNVWRISAFALPLIAQAAPNVDLADAYADWTARESADRTSLPDDLADLPLTTVEPATNTSNRIALILTGDGGWAGLDKGVAEALAGDGMRVAGFSTLKFFWQQRSPAEATDAVARILTHYTQILPETRFTLVGYSFGASLVPVLINRLPAALIAKIDAGVMISPDPEAVFEIKIGDWFGGAHHEGGIPVMPEILSSQVPILCIHGADESDSFCRSTQTLKLHVLSLPGGHHYDGDYKAIGDLIVREAPKR